MDKAKKYILIYGLAGDEYLAKLPRRENYLIPETRPGLLGAEALLPKFREYKLKATLVSDNMLGIMFSQKAIKEVRLFYFTKDSFGFLSPCGSGAVAILAQAHAVAIDYIKGGIFEYVKFKDSDASSFLGKRIVNYQCSVIQPKDELIPFTAPEEKNGKICKTKAKKK